MSINLILGLIVAAVAVVIAICRVTGVIAYQPAGALSILNISDNASAGLMDWYSMTYDDAAWRDNVFLSLVDKQAAGGQQIKQAIKIARSAGHGADIAQAINNASSEARKAFFTPWGKSYVVENVDNTEIDVSEEDDGAIVEILGDAMEGCMRKANEDLELDCFGDAFGSRGTISSHTGSGPTFVLTVDSQASVLKWQVGDIGVSSVANNSSSLDTGSFTVNSIDTDAFTLSVTANASWAGGSNDAHFIFWTADKIAGSTNVAQKVNGLRAWLPAAAPTAGDNFGGVDRSVDPNKLAGVRLSLLGQDPVQVVNRLLTQICLNKAANPSKVLCAPTTYADMQESLQNKAIYDRSEGTGSAAGVYFEGIKIMGPKGPVMVHAAPGCDTDRIYALDMRTWILRSPKNKPVKMAGRAGKDGLIDSVTSDSVQIRMKYLANLSCSFPGANGVAKIA